MIEGNPENPWIQDAGHRLLSGEDRGEDQAAHPTERRQVGNAEQVATESLVQSTIAAGLPEIEGIEAAWLEPGGEYGRYSLLIAAAGVTWEQRVSLARLTTRAERFTPGTISFRTAPPGEIHLPDQAWLVYHR